MRLDKTNTWSSNLACSHKVCHQTHWSPFPFVLTHTASSSRIDSPATFALEVKAETALGTKLSPRFVLSSMYGGEYKSK